MNATASVHSPESTVHALKAEVRKKSEARSQKSEGSPKSKVRNPNAQIGVSSAARSGSADLQSAVSQTCSLHALHNSQRVATPKAAAFGLECGEQVRANIYPDVAAFGGQQIANLSTLCSGTATEDGRYSRLQICATNTGRAPNVECGGILIEAMFLVLLTAFFLLIGVSVQAQALKDEQLAQIRFEQKLQTQVPLDLAFRDEAGHTVRLGQYFGKRPILLVLGYYECPMLCTLVLNGMVESAQDMRWSIGREFEVINVSINPAETASLAAAKKRTYLRSYGRSSAAQGWHFLTGDEPSIQRLAKEIGFHYAYDASSKQFAHPSGLVVLTPSGKVSKYLFGVTYAPRDLFSALQAASFEKVGSPIQQLILLCFRFNPITGKYSGAIIIALRVMAATTLLGVLGLIVVLVRRGRAAERRLGETVPGSQEPAIPVATKL